MAAVQGPVTIIPPSPPQQTGDMQFGWFKKIWDLLNKMIKPAVEKTVSFTAGEDYFYPVTDAGGNVVVTLPLAASRMGKVYTVKKTNASTNTVTLLTSGSDTIDGGISIVLRAQYDTITVQSDGVSKWNIINGSRSLQSFYPYADVEKQASQSLTGGTPTKITFPTTNYNINTWWDSANNKYLPTVKGDYKVEGIIVYSSATANTRCVVSIYKNGNVYGRTFINLGVTANFEVSTSYINIVPMNGSSDYIEIFVTLNNNGTVYGGSFGNAYSCAEFSLLTQT